VGIAQGKAYRRVANGLRIGLVTGEYPPDQGGVGDFTRELATALSLQGHSAHVITTGTSEYSPERKGHQVTVHRVIPRWDWSCWRKLRAAGEALSLDVLNIQYQTAAFQMHPAIHLFPWWRRRRGEPVIVTTFHDLRAPYLFPKAGPLRRAAVIALARWARGVIVTNSEDERELARAGLVTEVKRIPIGSNISPVLPQDYDRNEWRRRWGVGADDYLLGYFGFLNERKGGEALIETLAGLIERGISSHLLLIGGKVGTSDLTNRSYAARVERLIENRDLCERVHRTGFVPPAEVSACLASVDVCVLPYSEGASLRHGSLHACLAHGRPIVTTSPAGDAAEFSDGVNMVLAPRGDVDALVDAAAQLWSDRILRVHLAEGSLALSREFTWGRIASRSADFFAELMP